MHDPEANPHTKSLVQTSNSSQPASFLRTLNIYKYPPHQTNKRKQLPAAYVIRHTPVLGAQGGRWNRNRNRRRRRRFRTFLARSGRARGLRMPPRPPTAFTILRGGPFCPKGFPLLGCPGHPKETFRYMRNPEDNPTHQKAATRHMPLPVPKAGLTHEKTPPGTPGGPKRAEFQQIESPTKNMPFRPKKLCLNKGEPFANHPSKQPPPTKTVLIKRRR